MPRFVILEHDHPERHWDLMLETGPTLRTWRLAQPPAPGAPIAALALPDHRLDYLSYEGPVSGNRGTVVRWDAGWYEQATADEPALTLALHGTRTAGRFRLAPAEGGAWELGWMEAEG